VDAFDPELNRAAPDARTGDPATPPRWVGQKSDTVPAGQALDQAGRELNQLARISLVVTRIDGRAADLPELLSLASPHHEQRAAALAELVEAGCRRLGAMDERFGEVATRLFGAEPGAHGRPYPIRLAEAADSWQEGMAPATFNRRHRSKVIRELMRAMKLLRRDANAPAFRLWLERDPAFLPIRDEDDRPNLSFKRLHVHARSHIQGVDRRNSYTDWTYNDVVTRPTDGLFRIFTKEDNARVELVPRSSNVQAVRPLGLDRHGSQVWLMQLLDLPPIGQDFEWSVRKVFHRFDDTEAEPGWLALAVSQPRPILSGTFELAFGDAVSPPVEFYRFVTPKQTLPNLRGQEWEVQPKRSVATAIFDDLQPNKSHGLMWSWRHGGVRERVRR
jgi:hypothetical protein